MERVAIIDMGSNSIRFIVIQVADNKSYHLEYQQKEAIRLGRGMSETGRLNPEGVERAMACLHVYKHMMEVLQVTKCIAVATAAFILDLIYTQIVKNRAGRAAESKRRTALAVAHLR